MNITTNKNNYILSIETSNKIAGVSILKDGIIKDEINLNSSFTHSITIFKLIYDILKKNNLTIKDIDIIKVSNGPGSYTGIRIGISAVLGLAMPYDTKIEYVNTLKSLAYNEYNNKYNLIISIIDAKVNRVYMSIFDGKTFKSLIENIIVNVDDLCKVLNKHFENSKYKIIFVGDGVIKYNDTHLKKILKIKYFISKNCLHKASSVALCDGIISKNPIINYLQLSKAEREKINDKN